MYSLVVLLSMLATSLFLRAYTGDERPARRWPVLFGLALAADALHAQLGALPRHGDVHRVARAALPGAAGRAPAAAARRRARLRPDRAAVPAVGADAAVPGRAHRRAVVAQARATRTSRWRRRTGCSATRRGSCWWSAAGGGVVALVRAGRGRQLTAEGRAVLAVGDRRRSGRCCSPTAPRSSRRRGRCATWRSPSRRSCCCAPPGSPPRAGIGLLGARDRRDPVGLRRVADDQEQRPRGRGRDRARASAPATSSSRPSPSRSRCSTTTCRRAALRDADRLRQGRRRDRLARRRRAPRGDLAAARPRSRSSTGSRPAAGSSSITPIIFDMARWRAPWTKLVRRALGGVQPVRDQRRALPARPRSTRRCRASAARTRSPRPCSSRPRS